MATDYINQLRLKLFGTTTPQPVNTSEKTAQRTLVRGSDGKMRVQFQDTNTGAVLGDLTGYNIIEQGENLDWLTAPGASTKSDTATADAVTEPLTDSVDAEMEQLLNTGKGGDSNESRPGNGEAPTTSNNFGYIDKSSLIGLAGMAPGPVGMGAKLVSTGINANNVQAVNAARKANNLPSLDSGQMAGGVLGANDYSKGYIGDVNIGDQGYAVKFEGGLTSDGRTSLTPGEMRQRNELAGNTLALSTDEQKAANVATYEADDLDPGAVGQVANRVIDNINTVTRDIGSLFGWAGTEISKVSSEAVRDVTPTRVAEAIQTAKTTAVERSSIAPVGAIGRQREAVDRAPANYSSPEPSYGTVDARTPKANINYSRIDNGAAVRDARPSLEVADRVREAVAAVNPGLSVSVNSGGGALGSDRHRATNRNGGQFEAMDFGLVDNATGRRLNMDEDRATFVGISGALAARGIKGIGEYDNKNFMHADVVAEGAWGVTEEQSSLPSDFKAAIEAGRAKAGDYSFKSSVPAPTFREDVVDPYGRPTPAPNATPKQMSVEDALQAADEKRQRMDAPSTNITQRALGPQEYNSPKQYAAVDARSFLGDMDAPLGMTVNNPGNLKHTASDWQNDNLPGLVGPSTHTDQGDPQAVFNSPQAGLAATGRLAVGKFDEGMNTLSSIVAGPKGWTPGADFAANNIAKIMGIAPDDPMDLRDPTTLASFMGALITQEQGPAAKAYTPSMIQEAVDTTLYDANPVPDVPTVSGFAGKVGSPRSISQQDPSLDSVPTTSGFTSNLGSPRSLAQNDTSYQGSAPSTGFAGSTGSARSMSQSAGTDYSGNASSGYAGNAGSARSQAQNDSSFDSGMKSLSGFAGGNEATRSASRNDVGSKDIGNTKSTANTSRNSPNAGPTSSPSQSTTNTDSGGSSKSIGNTKSAGAATNNNASPSSNNNSAPSKSGGFAGSAGSASAASRGDSNASGAGSSAGSKAGSMGNNKSGDTGNSSSSGKQGGLGTW